MNVILNVLVEKGKAEVPVHYFRLKTEIYQRVNKVITCASIVKAQQNIDIIFCAYSTFVINSDAMGPRQYFLKGNLPWNNIFWDEREGGESSTAKYM